MFIVEKTKYCSRKKHWRQQISDGIVTNNFNFQNDIFSITSTSHGLPVNVIEENCTELLEDYWRKHSGSYHRKVKER